ncbi:MAG TPA: NUDIX hydrolase [Bacilli bacterium]
MNELSAGGVVYRRDNGDMRILLIQDRFGNMTLPKGKLEHGETMEAAALREIREETGIVGRIVAPLATVAYQFDHAERGRVDKEVHYFLVEAVQGEIQPQLAEIRAVAWFSVKEAQQQQLKFGYRNNDEVLAKALAALRH